MEWNTFFKAQRAALPCHCGLKQLTRWMGGGGQHQWTLSSAVLPLETRKKDFQQLKTESICGTKPYVSLRGAYYEPEQQQL